SATGPVMRLAFDFPRAERASSIALSPTERAGFSFSSLTAAGRLRDVVHHEADVREAGERGRLEHALHDDRLHVLVDLEDDDAREVLARVELLPHLTLALQDVEELVDALEAVRVLDRAR